MLALAAILCSTAACANDLSNGSNGSSDDGGPVTPNKVAAKIVDDNHAQKPANPVQSATCDPQASVNQTDGSGPYECTLIFESGGMGWINVTVNKDGSYTKTNQ